MLRLEDNPKLKNLTFLKTWKYLVLFLLGLFGLSIVQYVTSIVTSMIAGGIYGYETSKYHTFTYSPTYTMIINGVAYVVIFSIFMVFASKDISEYLKSFKKWQPYVAGLIGFAIIIAFSVIYNSILSMAGIKTTDNANETAVNSVVGSFPLSSLLILAFIGPICEELTYRVGLFTFLRRINGILAYVVTIAIFALIHFDFQSETIVNELLNLPFYAFTAFVFSFLYERFGLAGSLTAHVVNNFISIGGTILGNLTR